MIKKGAMMEQKPLFKIFNRPHAYLSNKSKLYYSWHQKKYSSLYHFLILITALAVGFYFTFYSYYHSKTLAGSLEVPKIVAPFDGNIVNTRRPTLKWSQVTGANTYRLKIFQDDNLLKDINVTSNSYTPDFDLPDKGNYYWQVQALNQTLATAETGTTSNSAYAAPKTNPQMLSPTNGQMLTTGSNGLAQVKFVTQVQVRGGSSSQGLATSVVYRKVGDAKWSSFGTATSTDPDLKIATLPNGISTQWLDANGWNCAMDWGTKVPPANCSSQWSNGSRSGLPAWSGYNIFSPTINLGPGTYEWSIRAKTSLGISDWANKNTFSIKTPVATSTLAAPVNTSPSNGQHLPSTTTSVILDWSDVAGANGPIKYIYQSSFSNTQNPDGSFTTPAWTSGLLGYSTATATGLTSGKTLYWHAKAQDSLGNQSAWSSYTSYTVDAVSIIPPPTVTTNASSDFSIFWNFSVDTSRASEFTLPDPSKKWLGAFAVDSGDSVAAFKNIETLAAKPHQIAQKFKSFYWDPHFPTSQAQSFYNAGKQFMVTWEPWDPTSGSASQPSYSNAAIINNQTFKNSSGATVNYDTYLKTWATDIKAYKKPVYIRFAHEMNGNWYPWGDANGNTPASYVAMWRHVHDIFEQQGVKNVRWVWCVNGTPENTIASYFPGDNYVDAVAIDGYNWGNTKTWSTWIDFKSIFTGPYNVIAPITKKDIWVGETASVESGGSKATWIANAYSYAVLMPRLKTVLWFNSGDWAITTSPAATSAYKAAVQNFQ